jgi:hypothetical protein
LTAGAQQQQQQQQQLEQDQQPSSSEQQEQQQQQRLYIDFGDESDKEFGFLDYPWAHPDSSATLPGLMDWAAVAPMQHTAEQGPQQSADSATAAAAAAAADAGAAGPMPYAATYGRYGDGRYPNCQQCCCCWQRPAALP